ncbi:MAG TPA: molybdenum cofactor guanylyltransferase MobA [Burkholderiaceae bacterium]|nr:molybdenum cofactor guanylyltransferase MobA [Burkholderiaceae bacterium]
MTIPREQITGIVLAGGRGSRMGGVDKGLQNHKGVPLALHALLRLQPQVGEAMINANRNLGAYESMGVPVWPDAQSDFPGPLAGVLVGLERCETPYLVTVPCDTPNFPLDLVERLAHALEATGTDLAMAATRESGEVMAQPVFCLLKAELLESLVRYLQSGQRKIDHWTAQHRVATVVFDDAAAFDNANTVEELQRLQR